MEVDRDQYRDSFYLWSMAKGDREVITTHLFPGGEWGVFRGNGGMSMKVPSSKQQVHMLGLSWGDCNDGTVKLFKEEVQYRVEKLPLACQFNPAKPCRGRHAGRYPQARVSSASGH